MNTVEQNNVRVLFGKQLNIGIEHQIFLCLKIRKSDIGSYTRIGQTLAEMVHIYCLSSIASCAMFAIFSYDCNSIVNYITVENGFAIHIRS